MQVVVLGLGYVGTVTAAVLASNGHDVCGTDVDPTKVHLLRQGRSSVIEPGLDDLVAAGVAARRLRATSDLAEALDGADASFVCVGTPSSPTGGTDLCSVQRAVTDIADTLAAGAPSSSPRPHAVVVRSTVPPGTLDEVVSPLLAQRGVGPPSASATGSWPEFLREGTAIADFYGSTLTVVGTHDPCVAATMRRMLSFLASPVRVVAPCDAEALKYACNAFHATKVSFANEMGRLLRLLGVDARRVMEMLCEDTKLNISASYLAPGFAFGGSCLPKDLRSLLHLGRARFIDLPLLAGTLSTNEIAIGDLVNRVIATDARAVALLGLSFKAGSDDLRESPYVDVAETLIGKGFDVRVFDPVVDPSRLVGSNRRHLASRLPHVQRVLRASADLALEGADLALVSSADRSVVDALVRHPPPRLIDLCGRLGPAVEALAQYEGAAW